MPNITFDIGVLPARHMHFHGNGLYVKKNTNMKYVIVHC